MKKIMFNDRYGLTEAVLSGQKTQTRRIVPRNFFTCTHDILDNNTLVFEDMYGDWHDVRKSKYCFKIGEVVAVAQSYKDCGYGECAPIVSLDENGIATFGSDAGSYNKMFVKADIMPHRIRITNVRVERLQDISDEDCIKEGIYPYYYGDEKEKIECGFYPDGFSFDGIDCHYPTPREAYAALIDKVSGKGTWESNPYVFAYDFELVK